MPSIPFPASTSPGKDAIEGAGRLINAYAEKLQMGGPGQYVRRRPPGLTAFCETSETGFKGMWYDGDSYIYAAWEGELFYIDSTGAETSVGAILGSQTSFLGSSVNTSNLTTYTYAAATLGTAHFNRRIVVAVFYDAADDDPAAAVTIGGVAATLVKSQADSVALYIALVPTGTTGDIVVQYATAANRSAIGWWRLDGATTNTAHNTTSGTSSPGGGFSVTTNVQVPDGGVVITAAKSTVTATLTINGDAEDFEDSVESAGFLLGANNDSSTLPATTTIGITGTGPATVYLVGASWAAGNPSGDDVITFAKNNATTPDQVLVTPGLGAFTFTTSSITVLDVNGEIANSVAFGEGYFFFSTADASIYASGLNATTVNALDVTACEQRAEALLRLVFYDGELYAFGESHTEVFASRGSPNLTGFPLNYTTSIWRGIIAPLAVCGFEAGFEGGLYWVADDNSVRRLRGYQAETISNTALERAIEACTDKSSIRAFAYDVDGHACVVIDLAGEATWVLDVMEGGLWHERDTADSGYWRAKGNSVKAFDKWIVGDHNTGNLYEIDKDAMTDGGSAMPFIVESTACEAFPQRIRVSNADLNFVSGVGTTAVPDPKVKIAWSDSGGHRWTDYKERKLGENGRFEEHIRINGCGVTGPKGRRWRVRVDDEVYVGLIGGTMDVSGL